MNVSLLAKWRLRLLDGDNALWKDVLEEKYGPCKGCMLDGDAPSWPRFTSVWWKELVKLDNFGDVGWFKGEIVRKVGNGLKTSFWKDKWCQRGSFAHLYPRLYSISNQKEALVGEIGEVLEGVGDGISYGDEGCLCGKKSYLLVSWRMWRVYGGLMRRMCGDGI
jgi:hypothetical protein